MEKRAKVTVDLMPELIQRVAMLIETSKDMLSLLQALPAEWLTEPLAALRKLYCAVHTRRLVVPAGDKYHPNHVRLWPSIALSYNEIQDPELRDWIAKAMVLCPVVDIHEADLPPSYPLQPSTKVRMHNVNTWSILQEAMAQWPDHIESIKLVIHDVRDWPLAPQVASALQALPALREVVFELRDRVEYDMQPFLQALASKPIRCAKVHGNCFTWSKAAVTAMAQWLHTGSLKTLELTGVSTTDELTSSFHKAIATSPTLASVTIYNYNQETLPLRFFQNIQVLPRSLVVVDLQDLEEDALSAIALAITSSPQLRTVALSFNEMPPCPDVVLALIETLGRLRSLRSCEVSKLPLSMACVASFAALLPQLTTARLSRNELDDDAAAPLVSALPRCASLNTLHLTYQELTEDSVASLAAAVPQCPSLKNVHLGGNMITSSGARALCGIFHHLEVIDLTDNQIGVRGALDVSHVVRQTCHLKRIGLALNPLTKYGVRSILKALGGCVYREGFINLVCTLNAAGEDGVVAENADSQCEDAITSLPDAAWVVYHEDDPRSNDDE